MCCVFVGVLMNLFLYCVLACDVCLLVLLFVLLCFAVFFCKPGGGLVFFLSTSERAVAQRYQAPEATVACNTRGWETNGKRGDRTSDHCGKPDAANLLIQSCSPF